MVVFTLLAYYSRGEINPITGEKQWVGMTEEEEVWLGLQARNEMVRQHGGLHADARGQARVNEIGQQLLIALDQLVSESGGTNPYRDNFVFQLLADTRSINAFALPGGQVFVTASLYTRLRTDGQLAGVLGHEVGHVLSRHGAQRMAKQKLAQGLAGAAGVAGGDMQTARMVQAIGQMVNMKYGREDELESDVWGVRLMAAAGYDPRSMLGVMDILDEASEGGGPPEMLSTHPKPANRKVYLRQVIEQAFPDGVPAGLHP